MTPLKAALIPEAKQKARKMVGGTWKAKPLHKMSYGVSSYDSVQRPRWNKAIWIETQILPKLTYVIKKRLNRYPLDRPAKTQIFGVKKQKTGVANYL